MEARPWSLLLFLLGLVFLPAALGTSHGKPLWHDELFTYYIAQAPTLREMWVDQRSLDLNPPLIYLLTRLSFRGLGVSTLATRLPEILLYLVMLCGLFSFVRRRLGTLFGGWAISLLMLGKTFDLAVEARPYTLLLGFLALALVGWQQAAEDDSRGRRAGLALLGFAAAGMLLSHIFAVPALFALLAGEMWREWRRRRFDWAILAAMLLPFACVAFYLPMLRNHGGAIYPQFFQPDGQTIFDFYIGLIEREIIALLLAALLVLLVLGPRNLKGGAPRDGFPWSFPQREWVVIVGLLALPLLLMLRLMLSHGAFFARYGSAATLGLVLLCCALLARWTMFDGRPDPRAALLGMIVALLISAHTFDGLSGLFSGRVFHGLASGPTLPVCAACGLTSAPGTGGAPLPLVDAGGITFVEMNHHESAATLSRIYYLVDTRASTDYAHANIFERMPELVERFHLHGHATQYATFVAQHRHFYVLGTYDWPEDWLLRKLRDDGANLRVMGRTADEYRDKELYEVNLP